LDASSDESISIHGGTPISVIKRGRVVDVIGVLAGVYSGAFD
jgi:hypothetical protein